MNSTYFFLRACVRIVFYSFCMLSVAAWADTSARPGVEKLTAGPLLSGEINLNSGLELRSPVRISAAVKNSGSAPSAAGEVYVTFGGNFFQTEKMRLPVIQPGQTQFFHFSNRQELPTSPVAFSRDDWGSKLYDLHIAIGGADRVIAQQNLTLNYSFSAHPHTAKSFSVRVPADTTPTPAGLSNPNLEKINIPRPLGPAISPEAKTPPAASPAQVLTPESSSNVPVDVGASVNTAPSGINKGAAPIGDSPGSKPGVLPAPPGMQRPRIPPGF